MLKTGSGEFLNRASYIIDIRKKVTLHINDRPLYTNFIRLIAIGDEYGHNTIWIRTFPRSGYSIVEEDIVRESISLEGMKNCL